MINHLLKSLERKLAHEARERESEAMRRVCFWELERRYTEVRKQEYKRVKDEVKRGLRSSIQLLEYEYWRGF